MFGFYDIDVNYIKFLKTIDRQVPNISYCGNNKFVCGIVLNMNGVDYYAPISHMTNKLQTNMLIYDKQRPISSIRFSFMIPSPKSVLTLKDFNQISTYDKKYADLLRAEYLYCIKHKQEIHKKRHLSIKLDVIKSIDLITLVAILRN